MLITQIQIVDKNADVGHGLLSVFSYATQKIHLSTVLKYEKND